MSLCGQRVFGCLKGKRGGGEESVQRSALMLDLVGRRGGTEAFCSVDPLTAVKVSK